jgi:mRNA-degrading endonuclease HigB of HigAB toxin-antitoxin module
VEIVKPATLAEYAKRHPVASSALASWQTIVKAAKWNKSEDVKQTLNSVDIYVTKRLKRTLYIFNICGKDYRLICGIHFPRTNKKGNITKGKVFIREFMTHPEYMGGQWKATNDKD